MPQPNARDLHVSRPLSNISVAYQQRQQAYIAGLVFPYIGVQNQGDLYYKYTKGDWFRDEAELRAPATESAGGGFDVTTDSYFCKVYAFHKDVDDQTRANADAAFNLDRDAALFSTRMNLLKMERLFVARYLTTGVWTGNTDQTGVAAAPAANQFLQFNDAASVPITVVNNQQLAIERQTGYLPNTLVMGPSVQRALEDNPSILDRIKYTQRGIITLELLASLFNVDRVFVPRGVVNTGTKGLADSFSYISDKSMLLVYSAPEPSLMQPSGGYTFGWNGMLGAAARGTRTKRFRMEPIESWRIETDMAFDQKIVAPDVGVFFASAVA
jgi:hypothetical protein